jgi:lactoylglutathione lyase
MVAPMQVIFAVQDLARSLEFYERAFGWPRNERIDFSNYAELVTPGGETLGLFERDGYARITGGEPADVPEGRIAPSYLYMRVEDVDAAVARIEAAGGRPLSALAERSWAERAAWFADPDGNVVAVAAPAQVATTA